MRNTIVPSPHNRILVSALSQVLASLAANSKRKITALLRPNTRGIPALAVVYMIGPGA